MTPSLDLPGKMIRLNENLQATQSTATHASMVADIAGESILDELTNPEQLAREETQVGTTLIAIDSLNRTKNIVARPAVPTAPTLKMDEIAKIFTDSSDAHEHVKIIVRL